mmetsp:Transcript_10554/g.39264  ORF Transcript_10554/g.39264 Transcript_10554/m.39264 type:complete len:316 (-) Transcript_10554:125-1072(-)|eukprot:CAMPEP_0117446246 /NCGR_PEP_ID=MMETSP0759-20121206/6232_1 /TAXON_ID=63605 /ORGANISM="Percolomonas cosmopolitus, Strain WS" /LENGTH=315 /DNA_ID=CAMNT_0005238487 /DNA_START=67 /DNA_END=1014 /DNA_ORIENTATION=+
MNNSPIVIFPTDFSQTSVNALPFAANIAKHFGLKLALVNVENRKDVKNADLDDPFEENAPQTENMRLLCKLKDRVLQDSRFKGVKVVCTCRFGNFRSEVVALSRFADIMILGTKGAGTVKGLFFGSNTSHILAHLSIPCLIVPPEADGKNVDKYFGSVALASEFSKEQIEDLEVHEVIGFAEAFDADVSFVHVEKEFLELTKPQVVVSGNGSLVFPAKFDDQDVKEMAKQKGRLMKKKITSITDYKKKHYVVLSIEKSDNVQEALSDYCDRHNIGIIALVRRKRSVLQSLFHTSVSKAMSLHAQVPMIVFPEIEQ